MSSAVIIGFSGHAYVVLDTLMSRNFPILGYCEYESKAYNPYSLKYLGYEKDVEVLKILKENSVFICLGENTVRGRIFNYLLQNQISCPSIIDISAKVSPLAVIGDATVVLPGAIVNSCAEIGKAVICNSSSIIEHECKIYDYSHIAPGAVLAGNVTVGSFSFIGANSVIKQGITIGSNVIVGAGSVVTKDIPDNVIVYGNPAKIKR
ncbi:acetyltransferase [Pedobacter polysacchareus]|uniref:acetyltransferase n=1 Tax=Pedobacter polysacchareus TaxID=2861973 RepID=UPI001C99F843|nr:acetyltransferase [Pedobacter polysacchareus]